MPQKPSPWDLPKSSKTKITTGDVDLDKILNDTNLDVTADRLSDFISKRKMDRRTVWQGLPAILSTILGGGLQRNRHSWLDTIRQDRPTPIRKVTMIDIYSATNTNMLKEIFTIASDPGASQSGQQQKPSECDMSVDTQFWTRQFSKKNYKSDPKHSTTLLLATTVRQGQPSDCSLFNVIFTTMNPECTYEYDVDQLPASIKPTIAQKLTGKNVYMNDQSKKVYGIMLHRTNMDRQNRYEGAKIQTNADLTLVLTPPEFFLFTFFHYPVSKDRNKGGRNHFQRGKKNMTSNKNNANSSNSSNSSNNNSNSSSNSSNNMKLSTTTVTTMNKNGMGGSMGGFGFNTQSRHNSAQKKRNFPDYLAYASLREIVHDDPYMLLVHQYCEFFLPLENLAPSHEEEMFINILSEFWLRQTLRPRQNIGQQSGFSDNSYGGQTNGGGASRATFRPTSDQCVALMVFITHVHLRDRPVLYQPTNECISNGPVLPCSSELYGGEQDLLCGDSRTVRQLQSSMYDYFCFALTEAQHRSTTPVFSMTVDVWLAYCKPWEAARRTNERPRGSDQRRSNLGIDRSQAARTAANRESHSSKRKKKGGKGAAWADKSARKNDPVTREWTSYIVHNYWYYIEPLQIILERSLKFEYGKHGSGELELMERVLSMYSGNLRAVLKQCRLHILALLAETRFEKMNAQRELDRLAKTNLLVVGKEFRTVLLDHTRRVEPKSMGKTLDLYRDMPDLGKDLIKYMDDELQNLNNEKSSNSSSLFQSMKDYYHGKKGRLAAVEPQRDSAGFITSGGRDQLQHDKHGDRTCNAVHWNNNYGRSYDNKSTKCCGFLKADDYPGDFMREVMSDDRCVLRLIPQDPMLKHCSQSEIRPLVWMLVSLSQTINGWFNLQKKWTEYVHVSGCEVVKGKKGRWFPINVEDTVKSLKILLSKPPYNIDIKHQRLTIIDDDDDPTNDIELYDNDERFVDLDLHQGKKLRLVDINPSHTCIHCTGENKKEDDDEDEDDDKKKKDQKKEQNNNNELVEVNKAEEVLANNEIKGGDTMEHGLPLGPWGEGK